MTTQLLIRKSHRYLGLFIGIQFVGWTVSGLYFSWNDLDSVHGDHMRKPPHHIAANAEVVSPTVAVAELRKSRAVDSIHSVHLLNIAGRPTYQLAFFSGHAGDGAHAHVHHAMADAVTGNLREPLSRDEAILVAKDNVVDGAVLSEAKLLEETDGHHEFRDRALPAWAVSFGKPACTVYVSASQGTFQAIRHDQWRAFDFLWMLHTMDYESRDNLNNWVLRSFSILGLITVLSGFVLFIVSSRTLKKIAA